MGVQMGIKIAAGVMLKCGGDHLACGGAGGGFAGGVIGAGFNEIGLNKIKGFAHRRLKVKSANHESLLLLGAG